MTEDAKPIDAEQEPKASSSTEASSKRSEGAEAGFDVVEEEDEEVLLNRALSRALKGGPKDESRDEGGSKASEDGLSEPTIDLDAAELSADEDSSDSEDKAQSEAEDDADDEADSAGKAEAVKEAESARPEAAKKEEADKDEASADKEPKDGAGPESDKGESKGENKDESENKEEGRVPSAREALGSKDSAARRGSRPIAPPRNSERRPSGRVNTATESPRRVPAPRRSGTRKAVPMRPENHPLHANLQSLSLRASNIEANTQKIARALVEIVKEGESRKKAYDTLYEEMRQYKEDFLYRAQKPLFLELITLFDSILRVERQYEAKEGMEEAAKDIRYLKDVLLEILYRYDIEVIEEHPEKLDISIQKPIKRVDVTDPEEDRVVVQYVREGFKRDNTVLRPQEIIVKRYCKAKEE